MKKITVHGSTEYDVLIENGLLAKAGSLVRDELGGERVLILTDSNVAALYLNEAAESFKTAGYLVNTLVLPAGEETKDIENYTYLLNVLAENKLSSSDVLVALGGGVVGDLAGFAGATYKRGMKLVQMPTSLLAAVDSSVGGKNAINLPAAKNQVGTIRNPHIVICDPELMKTLPEAELRNGWAEIIKYGLLNGMEIIEQLREAGEDYSEVIATAVGIKRDIVEMDEGDASFRQYLNLGHLIGHAIEADSDYAISHGEAVAAGFVLEARCCAFSGYMEIGTYMEISALLEEFGFVNSEVYSSPLENLLPYVQRDKRIRDGVIQILVPEKIGACRMRPLSSSQLESFLKAGN